MAKNLNRSSNQNSCKVDKNHEAKELTQQLKTLLTFWVVNTLIMLIIFVRPNSYGFDDVFFLAIDSEL